MALINTTTTGVLGTTVFGDGAGALTVQKDGVTQGIYGNIPAFSAYHNSTQSISGSTLTKLSFTTEEFDTNSNYDNSNSKFLPTVAGYYQINAAAEAAFGSAASYYIIKCYKNGSLWKYGNNFPAGTSAYPTAAGSWLVYCNGTTDYIEIYIQASTSFTTQVGNAQCYFQGFLVKAA